MALSSTERSQAFRARKRERAAAEARVAAVPDPGPGEVLSAVEELIRGLSSPDPVLSALARRLAAHMDVSGAANHQLAAELRRTVNDLRGRSRTGASGSGSGGGRVRANKVAELRGEYQAARSKRTAS